MRFLRTNTAVIITVGPFYDKTDGVTIETALTITNERITLTADTDDGAAPTNILDNVTGATSGTSNDLNYITGNDAGMMQLELSAANTNRLGRMMLSITDAANHVPVFHEFMVVPALVYDTYFASTGGATFPAATLASTTNITAGTITTTTNLTNLPAITSNWLTAAGIAAGALNGKGDWNIGKTGYALSSAGIQAIWDALTSALTTVGSIGKLLVDNINATISSRASQTSVDTIDDFLDTEVAAILADTNELQTDWVDGGRLDLILDARASQTSVNTVDDFLDTEIAAIITTLGTPAGASISADIAAIEAQTDDIGAAGAGLTAIPWNAAWDAEVESEVDDALVARNLDKWVLASGTADSGSTTTMVDAARTEADADYWKGRLILFTSGNIANQCAIITDFNAGTDTFTFAPAVTQAVSTQSYVILPGISAWDDTLAEHLTAGTTGNALNAAGGAGDPWSTALPGAYGAGTAGKIVGDNINATISSRASQASLDTLDDYVDTEVAAIKAKTDSLTFTVANQLDANVLAINGGLTSGNNATLNLAQLNIVNSGGSAIVASSTGGNGHGIAASGNGSGEGLSATGGATGHGIEAIGGSSSGIGMYARGQASPGGEGMRVSGAGSSAGLRADGGSSGANGATFTGTNNQNGIQALGNGSGNGLDVRGGATGHGLRALGGATSGDGINATAQTSGDGMELAGAGGGFDLNADIQGAVSGTVNANITQISGDSTAADNAESFFDGTGYAGTGNTIPTVTNVTNGVTLATGSITAAVIATDAIDSDAIAASAITEIQSGLSTLSAAQVNAEVVDALTIDVIADSVATDGSRPTIAQALLMINRFLMERSVSSTTMTVRKEDGSTSSMTFTLNDASAPTSITRAS